MWFANATVASMLTKVNLMDRKQESTFLETVNF